MLGHLFSASYLYAIDEQPPGAWPSGAVPWALVLAMVLALAWWRGRRSKARVPQATATTAAALAMFWLAVRPWLTGPFSARIWPLSLTVTALAAIVGDAVWPRLRKRDGPGLRAAALLLRSGKPTYAPRQAWVLAAAHAAGLLITVLSSPDTSWLAGLALVLPSISWLVERAATDEGAPWRVELLTPLWLYHGATLLRLVVEGVLRVDTAPYAAFAYPDLWSIWFNAEAMALASGAWAILCALSFCGHALESRWPRVRHMVLAWMAPVLALIWFGATVARHLSHGATGSDAYCYLQMASDLARHGTALHKFPLARWAAELGLPTWPLAHVGYHPPSANGMAATVWPIGWPVMLAPLIATGGEALALWGAPIYLVLTSVAVWRLPHELSLSSTRWRNDLVGGLAAALTLTSSELVLRSLVPMADAAASLWTSLFMLCMARAHRTGRIRWDALAGLALGMAYWVRHPLLWLGAGAGLYYVMALRNRHWRGAAVFCAVALLAASPDLLYHTLHWGALWRTESTEWFLISVANIPLVMGAMLRDGFLRTNEFGYLWLFVVTGVWSLDRSDRDRRRTWSMMIGALGVLVFGLCYEALRWRDLLALVPFLSLWAAAGVVALFGWARGTVATRTLACATCLVLLAARATPSYRWPLGGQRSTFGYVTADQRAGFVELDGLLPEDAVVGAGINSGAVERYTGCQTMRPASWPGHEADRFLSEITARGSPVYFLDDGTEMTTWLMSLEPVRLEFIVDLDLPCFGLGGQAMNRPAALYRLLPLSGE